LKPIGCNKNDNSNKNETQYPFEHPTLQGESSWDFNPPCCGELAYIALSGRLNQKCQDKDELVALYINQNTINIYQVTARSQEV
jgi:hypothetical protein